MSVAQDAPKIHSMAIVALVLSVLARSLDMPIPDPELKVRRNYDRVLQNLEDAINHPVCDTVTGADTNDSVQPFILWR